MVALVKTKSKVSLASVVFVMITFLSTVTVQAQINENPQSHRWGAEFSAIGISVFSLYQGKVTYAMNPSKQFKTEIGVGFLIQPESTRSTSEAFNSDGLYSANQASAAVRQYFWRGLHFEQVFNFGNASISQSKVDGNDYQSFVVFSQTFLGYKFDVLKKDRFGLFFIGQAGIGSVPYSSDPWPTVESGGSSIYPLGDLKIGINF